MAAWDARHLVVKENLWNVALIGDTDWVRVLLEKRKQRGAPKPVDKAALTADERVSRLHDAHDLALISASAYGHPEVVDLLLSQAGASVHAWDDEALRFACGNGHISTVELLLDRGANLHAVDDEPLLFAVYYGHTRLAEILLDRGANVHARNERALLKACIKGHTATVALLLAWGANLHSVAREVMRVATARGDRDTMELLYLHGVRKFRRCRTSLMKPPHSD